MFEFLAVAIFENRLWYALPLIVTVSLVYGATRHEWMGPIMNHSFRAATWIVGFMSMIFAILFVISMVV